MTPQQSRAPVPGCGPSPAAPTDFGSNSARQEALGGGAASLGASLLSDDEPEHSPEIRDAVGDRVRDLERRIGMVFTFRSRAYDHAQQDTEPAEMPPDARDLVSGALQLALSSTTAGLATGLAGPAAGLVAGGAVGEVVTEMFKVAMEGSANAGLAALAGHWGGETTDGRDAYFRAGSDGNLSAGLELGSLLDVAAIREAALETADPVAAMDACLARHKGMEKQAYILEKTNAIDNWLKALAKADLGETAAGGADAGEALTENLSYGEWIFGDEPRGVLRVGVEGTGAQYDPQITSARLAGVNPKIISGYADRTVGDVGLPVTVDAHLRAFAYDTMHGGDVEIAENDAGELSIGRGDFGAILFLDQYAGGEDAKNIWKGSPEVIEGAQYLMKRVVWESTFAELGVVHG